MNISAISNNYSFQFNQQQKAGVSSLSQTISNDVQKSPVYFGRDLVNYKNNSLPAEIAEKMPKGAQISDLIHIAQKPENIVGQGANSIVYNIPYLDDYVLKVLNKDDPNKIDMNEFPSDVNLGQPVWQDENNPRLLILKKIEGKEHSIPNWSKTIWDGENYTPLSVTKEQARLFHNQLCELAWMPQSAYDQLAKDVKVLEDKGYKLDSINPNNLIVDKEKNQIHIIDYFKVKPHEREQYRNSYMDLVAVALDFTLFPEYYDKMGETGKVTTMQNVKNIQEKMYKGAQNAGLSCDDERFKTYIRTTSRWFTAHSVPNEKTGGVYFRYYDVRMEDFLNMLKNPVQWSVQR